MGLKDQSQVLHRLIRRIVEAESAVGVRRDYRLNISTQIHRNRLYFRKETTRRHVPGLSSDALFPAQTSPLSLATPVH
jgi:hypothetical protein